MPTYSLHPSNRLYRGEVTDVVDALETYVRSLEYEEGVCARLDALIPDKEGTHQPLLFPEEKAAARKCLAEYHERIGKLRDSLFAEWADSDDANVRMFGEAALSGDFSTLAI